MRRVIYLIVSVDDETMSMSPSVASTPEIPATVLNRNKFGSYKQETAFRLCCIIFANAFNTVRNLILGSQVMNFVICCSR